jgi:hypothetical protein
MSILRAERTRSQRPLGVVLYDGPSLLDEAPVVVIATGFRRTANPKTGDMVQTWILRSDVTPFAAIHNGQDASVCGSCPLRGILEKTAGQHPSINRQRACYVAVHKAPLAVYTAYQNGRYEPFDASRHLGTTSGVECSVSGRTAIPAPRPTRCGPNWCAWQLDIRDIC